VTNQTSTPTPPSPPRPSNRFFDWLRNLGITRSDGWVGGVCGGIAARTGLDPLIVRGIAVVVAILGGPALLCYAAAWLLLPDLHGDIHLERLVRGVFDGPLVAIAAIVVISFLPFGQGLWWLEDHGTAGPWWVAGPTIVLRVLWNIAVAALIVWLVIWVIQRIRGASQQGTRPFAAHNPVQRDVAEAATNPASSTASTASTGSADSRGDGTVAQDRTASDAGAAAAPGTTAPDGPPAPGAGASRDDMAAWRQQYAAWRDQHAAWQEQQRAEQLRARDARSAEIRAQSQYYQQQAREHRRARLAANPRTSVWYVTLALGVALVAGGIAGAVAAGDPGLQRYAATIGMAIAVLAVGLAMVIAGAMRRRSGFLTFVAIVLTVVGVGSFAWPGKDAAIGYTRLHADQNVTFTQFAGQVEVDADSADVADAARRVTVEQSFGAVAVYVGDGVHARIQVTSRDSEIHARRSSDGAFIGDQITVSAPDDAKPAVKTFDTGQSGTPDLTVRITQGHGGVYVYEGGTSPSSGIDDED
jgi:phage shock protein PspC (stress-responsive transcriptional regulator)